MDGLERGFDQLVESLVTWVPQLLGALLIILIGYWIAKALSKAVRAALVNMQLDNRLHAGHGGSVIERAVPSPTSLIQKVVFWLVFLGAVSLGATALGIDALNDFIGAIYGFIPQLIAALFIFLVGSAIAAGVATLVNNVMGDTPTGKMLESIVPVIVMGLTIFMILDQLNVAPVIVTATYIALVGSVALGAAIAFGLGGRDVAARMLDGAYAKGQESREQMKRDVAMGKERGKEKMNRAR